MEAPLGEQLVARPRPWLPLEHWEYTTSFMAVAEQLVSESSRLEWFFLSLAQLFDAGTAFRCSPLEANDQAIF